MPSRAEQAKINLNVDRNNLYREDSVTDIKVAAIRRLTPIKADGSDDDSRDPIFMGQTQLMSPSGPLLLQSLLEARTLEEAMDKFPAAMQKEVEKAMAQAEENHKRKAE
ncbi:MAG: cytoplasmic protein [Proteobacteria bacterium]|nr:cytoplasmic protein [Pseudomonadota bacterium]